MLEGLRTPFFLAAIILIALVVIVELSTNVLPRQAVPAAELAPGVTSAEEPPGKGIPYMAMVDGIVLYSMILMAASFLITDRVIGRIQGIATLIFSILLIFLAFGRIFASLIELMVMVTLLMATPFGTLAYIALWGHFAKGEAAGILSLLMTLKIAFAICIVLAQQRFLKNKGLMLLLIASIVANVVVAFLHAFVPRLLVSITDAIGGIIVAIIALILAIFLLVGAIISIVKVLRIDRATS